MRRHDDFVCLSKIPGVMRDCVLIIISLFLLLISSMAQNGVRARSKGGEEGAYKMVY